VGSPATGGFVPAFNPLEVPKVSAPGASISSPRGRGGGEARTRVHRLYKLEGLRVRVRAEIVDRHPEIMILPVEMFQERRAPWIRSRRTYESRRLPIPSGLGLLLVHTRIALLGTAARWSTWLGH
jgi:hypothetical protein